MKDLLVFRIFAVLAVLALVATAALPVTAHAAASKYQNLVWSEDFNGGPRLNTANWNYVTGGGGWGNGELETYTSNTANVNVTNGLLNIVGIYNPTTGSYTSGRLTTKNKVTMKYGRIDVRAKLPTGVGSWPAIWMLANGSLYGNRYLANGEIDIMEEVGADQNEIVASAHSMYYNPSNGNTRYGVMQLPTANTAFHTYSLVIDPEYLSYQVDNVEYYKVMNDHTGYKSFPYNQPYYLLLNLAIGGSWGGYKGVDTKSMPWTFSIDYVKIYQ
jgi:beta-glucanase (GH16 family)